MSAPHVEYLDLEPGNGTRYRLVISITPGRLTIAWPDMHWSCGDFLPSNSPGAEWLVYSGGLKSRVDAEVIANAVSAFLRERWSA